MVAASRSTALTSPPGESVSTHSRRSSSRSSSSASAAARTRCASADAARGSRESVIRAMPRPYVVRPRQRRASRSSVAASTPRRDASSSSTGMECRGRRAVPVVAHRPRHLDETAGVGAREDVGVRRPHVRGLAGAELACRLRLRDVVDARRAAADVLLGRLDELELRDPPEQGAPCRRQSLGVAHVTRVLVGDPQRERMESWQIDVGERLGEVDRGDAALLEVRAAPRRVDDDRPDVREGIAHARGEAGGLVGASRVRGERPAAALGGSDDLVARRGQGARRRGVDVAEHRALDAAGQQPDPPARHAGGRGERGGSLGARAPAEREVEHRSRPARRRQRAPERGEAQRERHPARVGERREQEAPLEPLAPRAGVHLLDARSRLLDQQVVAHPGGAGRDAGEAPEAPVEVLDDDRAERATPGDVLLHQLDAAARRVHLLLPEQVGRARRQAEPAVDAVLRQRPDVGGASATGHASTPCRVEPLLEGAAKSLDGRVHRLLHGSGDVGDPDCGAGDRLLLGRQHGCKVARSEADEADGRRLPPTRLLPGLHARLDAPDGGEERVELRLDGGGRSLEEHRDAARVEDVERARLGARRPDRSDDRGRVVRLDDERRRRRRNGVQPERDPRDQRQRPVRAAHELAEVVPGDVLHDGAARARDEAVAEDEGHPEDEVARRTETVPERPGAVRGDAGPDRRVAGRVEREPLAGAARARPGAPRGGSPPRPCR